MAATRPAATIRRVVIQARCNNGIKLGERAGCNGRRGLVALPRLTTNVKFRRWGVEPGVSSLELRVWSFEFLGFEFLGFESWASSLGFEPGLLRAIARLPGELGDLLAQPRHLAAGRVAMHLALARRAHELRLGLLHRLQRLVAVASLDRLLHLAPGGAHARTARLVDFGAAGNLARGFAG